MASQRTNTGPHFTREKFKINYKHTYIAEVQWNVTFFLIHGECKQNEQFVYDDQIQNFQ